MARLFGRGVAGVWLEIGFGGGEHLAWQAERHPEIGFIGALIGTWLAHRLKLPAIFVVDVAGQHFPVVWSIIGAALFVAVIHLISREA